MKSKAGKYAELTKNNSSVKCKKAYQAKRKDAKVKNEKKKRIDHAANCNTKIKMEGEK